MFSCEMNIEFLYEAIIGPDKKIILNTKFLDVVDIEQVSSVRVYYNVLASENKTISRYEEYSPKTINYIDDIRTLTISKDVGVKIIVIFKNEKSMLEFKLRS